MAGLKLNPSWNSRFDSRLSWFCSRRILFFLHYDCSWFPLRSWAAPFISSLFPNPIRLALEALGVLWLAFAARCYELHLICHASVFGLSPLRFALFLLVYFFAEQTIALLPRVEEKKNTTQHTTLLHSMRRVLWTVFSPRLCCLRNKPDLFDWLKCWNKNTRWWFLHFCVTHLHFPFFFLFVCLCASLDSSFVNSPGVYTADAPNWHLIEKVLIHMRPM